jgi:hypothetical protein
MLAFAWVKAKCDDWLHVGAESGHWYGYICAMIRLQNRYLDDPLMRPRIVVFSRDEFFNVGLLCHLSFALSTTSHWPCTTSLLLNLLDSQLDLALCAALECGQISGTPQCARSASFGVATIPGQGGGFVATRKIPREHVCREKVFFLLFLGAPYLPDFRCTRNSHTKDPETLSNAQHKASLNTHIKG